jgi:hypothetical protein
MDPRQAATQLCYARIAFGLGLMLAPRQMAKGWSGGDAVRSGGRVLAVALGARDLALGLGTLRELKRGGAAQDWLLAGALADGADLVGSLALRRSLPVTGSVGVAALAANGAIVSLWAARALGQPTP